MKIIAVIPARYASTRFPAKLMQDLNDEANELHREALEDIKG